MLQLKDENNFGCQLRDGIWQNIDRFKINGTIHLSMMRDSINKIEIPEEYWGDVLKMFEYRKYDRIKDFVEEMLADRVYFGIMKKILADKKHV